jgi:hypothetical protein
MAHGDRRKCKCCLKLFRPDPRSRHHQRYCSVPACRTASKVASQAHWLANRAIRAISARVDVPALRYKISLNCATHWFCVRNNKTAHTPLQDLIIAQPVGFANETASSSQTQLQEILLAQRAVLIGLIAHIVGTTFEDDIARSTDRLVRLGQDLLATAAARAQPADRGTGGD